MNHKKNQAFSSILRVRNASSTKETCCDTRPSTCATRFRCSHCPSFPTDSRSFTRSSPRISIRIGSLAKDLDGKEGAVFYSRRFVPTDRKLVFLESRRCQRQRIRHPTSTADAQRKVFTSLASLVGRSLPFRNNRLDSGSGMDRLGSTTLSRRKPIVPSFEPSELRKMIRTQGMCRLPFRPEKSHPISDSIPIEVSSDPSIEKERREEKERWVLRIRPRRPDETLLLPCMASKREGWMTHLLMELGYEPTIPSCGVQRGWIRPRDVHEMDSCFSIEGSGILRNSFPGRFRGKEDLPPLGGDDIDVHR